MEFLIIMSLLATGHENPTLAFNPSSSLVIHPHSLDSRICAAGMWSNSSLAPSWPAYISVTQPWTAWAPGYHTPRWDLFTESGLQHPNPENTWHSYLGRRCSDLRGAAECICMSTPPHHFCLGPNTCFPFKATSQPNICTSSINIVTGCSVNPCQPSREARWKRRQPSAGQLPLHEEEVREGRG